MTLARFRRWLGDMWWSWGFSRCFTCRRFFAAHAFWNPRGTNRGRLCCSLECCATAEGRPAAELEAELP